MPRDQVKRGYDTIAQRYLDYRLALKSSKHIHQFLQYIPKHSIILDVGCGVGKPVDDLLLKAGHEVVGLDISPEQIKLARINCPAGQYLVQDMSELTLNEYSVNALVSLYALFHVPRQEHGRLLKTFASYLPRGGVALLSMGDRAFEGEHELLGQPMWSSQYGTEKNLTLVTNAGFTILLNEVDRSGGEHHHIILAEKV